MQCSRSHLYKVAISILISLHYASGVDNANCNFDGQSLCRWQNYDVMISIHAAPDTRGEWSTLTGSSKADVGHSSHYVRLLPSGAPGDVQERTEGLMLSPVMSALPASTAGCLEFDYFLYGQPEDQINVYYLDNQLLSGPLVWKENGNYSGVWQSASIPFRYNKPFQLAIHGVISGHDAGTVIAIDDVRYTVSSASCHLNPLDARADDTNRTLTMQGMLTPASPTTTPKPSDCRDDPSANCWSRPSEDCFGLYEAWSKSHCPMRCGFCAEPPPCEDVLARCDQFPTSTCYDPTYALWARTQCRKTCGLCAVPTHPPTTTVVTTTTTFDPNGCYDIPNATCWSRQDDACFDNYKTWAQANCPLRCGYCTNDAAFCVDSISYCAQYTRETCTDPNYQWWARTNCRKHCNMCHPPTPPLTQPAGSTVPTPPPTCLYKGSTYHDGALWEDGCEYHCYCNAGRTVCNDKCLTLEVPPNCVQNLNPGLCCPVYNCPAGVMPHLPRLPVG